MLRHFAGKLSAIRLIIVAVCIAASSTAPRAEKITEKYKRLSTKIEELSHFDGSSARKTEISALKSEILGGIYCQKPYSYLGLLMLYRYGFISEDNIDPDLIPVIGQVMDASFVYGLSDSYRLSLVWALVSMGEPPRGPTKTTPRSAKFAECLNEKLSARTCKRIAIESLGIKSQQYYSELLKPYIVKNKIKTPCPIK